MYAFHASYSFPSEWVLYLELGATGLAVVVLALGFGTRPGWLAPLWRTAARACRRPLAAGFGFGIVVFLASALYTSWAGHPIPAVSDELGHLLTADTFAHGRWVNPPPPSPEHFRGVHVILDPAYTSKYPPGIGAMLAVGQVIGGHPGVGIWIGTALLAMAALWCLAAFLPPPWPLLGAILVTLRLGLGSYWGHSYWGGLLAAAAAFTFFGALQRAMRAPSVRLAITVALSLGVLANTRPWEGFAVALVSGCVVVAECGRATPERRRMLMSRLIVPAVFAGMLIGVTLPYYNVRVTGSPWEFPDWHYRAQQGHDSVFSFVADRSEVEAGKGRWDWEAFRPDRVLPRYWNMLARTLFFQLGLPLLLCLVGLRWHGRKPWMVWVGASFFVGVFFMVFDSWGLIPHYTAPVLPATVLLALAGARALATRFRRRLGVAPLILVAIAGLLCAFQIPAWVTDSSDWTRQRHDILTELAREPGRQLLIVPDTFRRAVAWVYNPGDWENAPVLMVADLGSEATERLRRAFPDRQLWRLEPEPSLANPTPVPVAPPWSDSGPNPSAGPLVP